jgi:hypothetical protein
MLPLPLTPVADWQERRNSVRRLQMLASSIRTSRPATHSQKQAPNIPPMPLATPSKARAVSKL